MSQIQPDTVTVHPESGRRRWYKPFTPLRIIMLSLAVAASLLAFFLAWPWWRDFSYWAESRLMWAIYFAVGFALAVYVFHTFFGNLRTLFEHDAIERAELADQPESPDSGDEQ